MQVKDCIMSAPGKAILHGEHAVVHGKVALAVSLNLRTFLRLKATSNCKVCLNLPNIDTFMCWHLSELEQIAHYFRGLLQQGNSALGGLWLSRTGVGCLWFRDKKEAVPRLDADLVRRLREFLGVTNENLDSCKTATLAFLYIYLSLFGSSELPSMTLSVWSELPTGAGLGSSAAYSVCLAAALLCASGVIPTPLKEMDHTGRWCQEDLELINSCAFQGEMIIHGNPSGVDNAVGTWGGMLRFLAGKIIPLSRVPLLRILLTNTRVPRSTKVLVARVKDKINKPEPLCAVALATPAGVRISVSTDVGLCAVMANLSAAKVKHFPSVMTPVLDSVDAVSCTCEKVLSEMTSEPITGEHYNILEELIDINQHHLNVMGVGHPSLDTLCRITLAKGLHSKLTGAGGGGCGITLLRPETDSLVVQSTVQDLRDCGFECWETSIGGPGVQQHSPISVKEDILEVLSRY